MSNHNALQSVTNIGKPTATITGDNLTTGLTLTSNWSSHSKEDGGAIDNESTEVAHWLRQFVNLTDQSLDPRSLFIVIDDGSIRVGSASTGCPYEPMSKDFPESLPRVEVCDLIYSLFWVLI